MYGFPLTIYLISGWLVRRYPGLDPFSHDAGHLWNTLLGWKIDPHFDPLHILSNILIFGGFILLSAAWKVLYEAQQGHTLATTGSVRLCTTPTICRLHPHHTRVSVSVAYVHHRDYVSDPGNDVREARAARRTRSPGRIWGNLPPIYDCDARLFPAFGRTREDAARIARSLID